MYTAVEAKDFKADPPRRKVVIGVSKHEIAVLKDARQIDFRVRLADARKQGRQTFAVVGRLWIVLDVAVLVDNGRGFRIARFDALQEFAHQVFGPSRRVRSFIDGHFRCNNLVLLTFQIFHDVFDQSTAKGFE